MHMNKKALIIAALCLLSLAGYSRKEKSAGNVPCNKDITQPAAELYRYLLDLSLSKAQQEQLIAGHWLGASFRKGVADYRFNMGEVVEIRRRSGKWIGMIDGWICPGEFGHKGKKADPIGDCMHYDDMLIDYTLWWKNGGIVHVDASFFSPFDGYFDKRYGGRGNAPIITNIDNILTPGTSEFAQWRKLCDRMVVFFKALEDRDIPVIFRPFTEAYLGTGFWYAYRRIGPEKFGRLYRDLYDYLTHDKKCNNILWDFQGDKHYPHYPGDEYVDVLTADSDYVSWNSCCYHNVDPKSNKPSGNAELGDFGEGPYGKSDFSKTPEKKKSWMSWIEWAKKDAPNLSFYTVWDRNWSPVKKPDADFRYPNFDAEYITVMNDPYLITRDKITVTPKGASLPYRYAYRPGNFDLTPGYGSWSVTEKGIACSASDALSTIYIGNMDWTDYAIGTEVKIPVKGYAGIIGRGVSSDIYYSVEVSANEMALYRNFVGVRQRLASVTLSAGKNDAAALSVSFAGAAIKAEAKIGGKSYRCDANDDSIAAGCAGLVSYFGNPAVTRFEVKGI